MNMFNPYVELYQDAEKTAQKYRKALLDCIEWVNAHDPKRRTNLGEIASIAANALEVCPKCSDSWAIHNDDGSCVVD